MRVHKCEKASIHNECTDKPPVVHRRYSPQQTSPITYTRILLCVRADQGSTKRSCYSIFPSSKETVGFKSKPNLANLARIATVRCGRLLSWLVRRLVELFSLVEWTAGVWFRPFRMVQSNRCNRALDRPILGTNWISFHNISMLSVLKCT